MSGRVAGMGQWKYCKYWIIGRRMRSDHLENQERDGDDIEVDIKEM
jgi:hypothetical protein